MPTATCPSNEDLKAYAWGGLPSASEDELADHLDSCQRCEAAVQTLERRGDSLLARLRNPVKPDPYQQEPECRQVVDRLLDDTVSLRGKPASSAPAALPPLKCPGPFREYDLLEILGEGGMGTVYKARHRKLNKLAAIKILPAAMAQDPERVARFKREMKAIGQLDHTHIVRALDAGEAEGRHYLALEYVEGLDLSKVSDRAGRLSVADACEIVRQVAVGLRAADEQGLIHRDIKPSNLMLTPKGHVKILDLGLAVFETDRPERGETTAYGQIVGTPDYIAPEQINDAHSVDARADIYSLGCTLYKLLTGQAPFSGPRYKSHAEKLAAHLRDPIPSIRLLLPKAPEKLATLIERMVAKDRDLRIPKPGQVVDALASFCAGADLVRLASGKSGERGAGSGEKAGSELASANLPSPAGSSTIGKDAKKADFDPYHKWLGIPPVEQPPSHYRLLGLQAFESDREVILGAVMRQSAHLKTYQLGQHAALTQKILNEVSAAKVCLLDSQRKAAYDDRLRKELEAREKAARVDSLPKAKPLSVRALPPTESIPLENPEIIPDAVPEAISAGLEPTAETGLADLFDQIGIAAPLASSSAIGRATSRPASTSHVRTGKGRGKSQASLWQRCVAAIPPRYRTSDWLAAAGGAAFLLIGTCAAILIVSIRDKDGNPVAEVTVPKGGTVVVRKQEDKKPKEPVEKAPVEPKAVQAEWPNTWKKVSLETTTVGDVNLMVLKPLRSPPPPGIKTSADEVLIVPVNLWLKQGENKSVPLTSWADKELRKSVFLKDDEREGKGNTFEFLGVVARAGVDTSQVSTDRVQLQLIFELPVKIPTTMYVALPGEAFGSSRTTIAYQFGKDDLVSPSPALAIAPFDAEKAKEHQEDCAKHLGVPVVETNSIGMKLVLIPTGEFMMGSRKELIEEEQRAYPNDKDYIDRLPAERPQHLVRITKPYRLGATDVTQEEYLRVMGGNPSHFQGDPKRPVEQVSWDDAVEFCRKLSEFPAEKVAHRSYALPTEAQWEHACRAETTTRWYSGDDKAGLEDMAWFVRNSGGQTHPVGEKRPNAWGLFDMHGNVWQWCQDWDDRGYFTHSTTDDPTGPATGTERIWRGGEWNWDAGRCRSATRFYSAPGARFFTVGFRVAVVPVRPLESKPLITNSLGMTLIYCPSGSFKMGSPVDEPGRSKNEDQVSVTISNGFYLGKFGVTQSDFKSVMGSSPWVGKPCVNEGDDYPATYVDWNDAAEFCRKLTATELESRRLPQGYIYAVPTEAQREYACRAGTTSAYSFGADASDLGDYAWWGGIVDNGNCKTEQYAHRIGQKKPNPWGFYDLHGNVWEWCRDYYAYKLPGGTDPLVERGLSRVTRGGAWIDRRCRSALRGYSAPGIRNYYLGFRVALVPSSSAVEAASPAASSGSTAASPDSPDDAWTEWKDVFDGKTLNGWKQEAKGKFAEKDLGAVKIQNGRLELAHDSSIVGVAAAETVPRTNYEVQVEAMRVSGNSDFASIHFPIGGASCNFVVGGYSGVVGLDRVDGEIAENNVTTHRVTIEDNRWYTLRLRVTDDRVQAWIDKDRTIDLLRRGRLFGEPTLASSWDGPLGIYAWCGKSAIRSIRIRRLKSAAGSVSRPKEPKIGNAAKHREVDLLKLVDPARDAVWGKWSLVDGSLGCEPLGAARIEIPYDPPAEYDYRIVFIPTRAIPGVNPICCGSGKQFSFVIGGQDNTIVGFQSVAGRLVRDINPTTAKADHWLVAGKRHVCVVKVRRDGVEGWFDERPVARYKTDWTDMSLPAGNSLRRPDAIGIVANSGVRVESATVTEITGEGKVLEHTFDEHYSYSPLDRKGFRVLGTPRGVAMSQSMAQFGRGRWRNDEQLWWAGARPNDKLVLGFEVRKRGKYQVLADLTKAPDYGIVRLSLDDRGAGDPIDLYNTVVAPSGPVSTGAFDLDEGQHKIVVEIIGANPAAYKAYMFGIDRIDLQAVKD